VATQKWLSGTSDTVSRRRHLRCSTRWRNKSILAILGAVPA